MPFFRRSCKTGCGHEDERRSGQQRQHDTQNAQTQENKAQKAKGIHKSVSPAEQRAGQLLAVLRDLGFQLGDLVGSLDIVHAFGFTLVVGEEDTTIGFQAV